MIISEGRKLIRKLFVLGLLLSCLGLLSAGVGTKASANFQPCCSVCEPVKFPPPICNGGCDPIC